MTDSFHVILGAIGLSAAVLSVVGGAYLIAAATLATRFLSTATRPARAFPPVSLLKPLHGAYPGMGEVLEGYCDQDYPAATQIVFGVQDPGDPAIAVVEALKTRRPDADIALAVDSTQHGANRKVDNLIQIAALARHEVLVISDADIAVPRDYLRQVAGALDTEGVGAVSCFYVGEANTSPWSQIGAMGASYGFLPNAILGRTLGLAKPCFGSTIALSHTVLDEIGHLKAFSHHLADDYEIGRAVRRLGKAVNLPPMIVKHLFHEPSLASLFTHELRWARTVKQIDPAGYIGSLITNPLPLAMIATAALRFSPQSLALVMVILGVRIACKLAIDRKTGVPAGPWWLIPARDLLSVVVYGVSFTADTVGWQGRRYRVDRSGAISQFQG